MISDEVAIELGNLRDEITRLRQDVQRLENQLNALPGDMGLPDPYAYTADAEANDRNLMAAQA